LQVRTAPAMVNTTVGVLVPSNVTIACAVVVTDGKNPIDVTAVASVVTVPDVGHADAEPSGGSMTLAAVVVMSMSACDDVDPVAVTS
jgi:L-cystine uptake protein TcyP (sodium:dicarboxylate symporter family)